MITIFLPNSQQNTGQHINSLPNPQDILLYIKEFKAAGADLLTIHVEACENVKETIDDIFFYLLFSQLAVLQNQKLTLYAKSIILRIIY